MKKSLLSKFLLFLILFCISGYCYSQEILWHVKKLPVRDGVIYLSSHYKENCTWRTKGVIIDTKVDSCFSITSGTVIDVLEYELGEIVLIKDNNNYKYRYLLRNSSLKVGQIITQGDFIGLLLRSPENNKLILEIFMDEEKVLPYYKFLCPYLVECIK